MLGLFSWCSLGPVQVLELATNSKWCTIRIKKTTLGNHLVTMWESTIAACVLVFLFCLFQGRETVSTWADPEMRVLRHRISKFWVKVTVDTDAKVPCAHIVKFSVMLTLNLFFTPSLMGDLVAQVLIIGFPKLEIFIIIQLLNLTA